MRDIVDGMMGGKLHSNFVCFVNSNFEVSNNSSSTSKEIESNLVQKFSNNSSLVFKSSIKISV